ncbi:hypothetical protein ccbrp13_34520 [Ktedonobacteria bacterium brp13]|nr:hypothetical protein ccbrp13_34520 [Ktedonobacteria bacterium brp13]
MAVDHSFEVGQTNSSAEQHIRTGRILVITSCTKDKHIPAALASFKQPEADELWDGRMDRRVARNYGIWEPYRVPSAQLYRGRQHIEVMQGVELLRQAFGRNIVDVKIISAGFGLIDEDELVPPYNVTFAGLSAAKVFPIAKRLAIPQDLQAVLAQDYDCAFFLLGEEYLASIGLPFAHEPGFPCVFLASQALHNKIPKQFPYIHVCLGNPEATSFGSALISLKGLLFHHFAHQIVQPSPLFSADGISSYERYERMQTFLSSPSSEAFLDLVSLYRKKENGAVVRKSSASKKTSQQLPFETMVKPSLEPAKNYGRPMRFYIPDWDDLVDPAYNFECDEGNPEKRRYDDEVYSHQIYPGPNYDGLLFSKSTIEQSQTKLARIKECGIHSFAKFTEKPILADCGAFSYVNEEAPPYNTPEILEYYQSLGFNYGVSIDHLIFSSMPSDVKVARYALTRKNALEFIQAHRAGGYTFTPVGVAQPTDCATR